MLLLRKILLWIGMILLQALVLNRVHIGGVGTPLLYIWPLLKEGTGTSREVLLLEAFALGLAVDVFSDTWGMNAAATVLLAFVRPLLLRFSAVREEQEAYTPGVRTMGVAGFTRYLVLGVVLHHAVLLALELFPTSADVANGLVRLLICSILTLLLMAALENIALHKK